jgi:hypothetical protein
MKAKITDGVIKIIKYELESGKTLDQIAPIVGYSDKQCLSRALKAAGCLIVKTLYRINRDPQN